MSLAKEGGSEILRYSPQARQIVDLFPKLEADIGAISAVAETSFADRIVKVREIVVRSDPDMDDRSHQAVVMQIVVDGPILRPRPWEQQFEEGVRLYTQSLSPQDLEEMNTRLRMFIDYTEPIPMPSDFIRFSPGNS